MGIFRSTKKPKTKKRTKKSTVLEWEKAGDIKKEIKDIVEILNLTYINTDRIFCYRTQGSKARAYARTWMMPKIFQNALGIEPAYVIEVIPKYYDRLSEDEKTEVLIHELLHIPKNFSGALVPHRGRSRHLHSDAKRLLREYKSLVKN